MLGHPLFLVRIAAQPTSSGAGGVRGMLHPWMGGVCGSPTATTGSGGYNGMLYRWLGGACASTTIPPIPPTPTPPPLSNLAAGGGSGTWQQSEYYEPRGNQRAFREDRDMLEILLILAIATESCQP